MKINWKAIPEGFKILGKVMERNKSTILVGAGLVGWIGTAVLVGKAAPKAQTAIVKAQKDKAYLAYDDENVENYKLTPIEKVKATWQYYIPATAAGVVSSAAIIYAHKLDLTKVASLVSTYQLTKGELKQLKDKIVEKDGEEKLDEYKKSIREDTLKEIRSEDIYDTGNGTEIFYEPLTHRYFYSDHFKVQNALIGMVEECTRSDGMYSLDELLSDLDLPVTPLSQYFVFFRDNVDDISCKRIFDLLKPHFVDIENGDHRHCTWLDIDDRVSDLRIYEEGGSFRRPRY